MYARWRGERTTTDLLLLAEEFRRSPRCALYAADDLQPSLTPSPTSPRHSRGRAHGNAVRDSQCMSLTTYDGQRAYSRTPDHMLHAAAVRSIPE